MKSLKIYEKYWSSQIKTVIFQTKTSCGLFTTGAPQGVASPHDMKNCEGNEISLDIHVNEETKHASS